MLDIVSKVSIYGNVGLSMYRISNPSAQLSRAIFVNGRLLEGVPSGALEGWTQANVQPHASSTGRGEVKMMHAPFAVASSDYLFSFSTVGK